MVDGYNGKARFISENYGDSALAKKFGVKRYPAIFVDDVLVATPKDFGFYGKEEGEKNGRYAPLKSAQSHQRFRDDLTRMIDLLLEGKKSAAREVAKPSKAAEIAKLPDLKLKDLDGKPLTRADLAGRVVLVEFWATWCPPCAPTLGWLGTLKKQYGDKVAIVAIAIESDEANVKKVAAKTNAPLYFTMGTPDLARSFGDISAVPTLFVFDRDGKLATTYFGAPPTLHKEAETKIAALVK